MFVKKNLISTSLIKAFSLKEMITLDGEGCTRRDFIKGSIAMGAAAALGLAYAQASSLDGLLKLVKATGEAEGKRWGMVIDLSKCVGCRRCVKACKEENNLPDGVEWAQVQKVGEKDEKVYWLPSLCMHCANPPCLSVCPTGATYKREDGIVLVDVSRCIGCESCVMACPYGARKMDPTSGFATKCTFCFQRVDKGLKPACVEACPVHARTFGDLNDPSSEVCKAMEAAGEKVFVLHPEMATDPSVRYIKP